MKTETIQENPKPKPLRQFYRRVLPETCVAFSSNEGKTLFKEALNLGYAEIFFPLSEQFHTQSEPAYCGLSTLVMVLNALAVDPKRIWKGGWRWYHEEMLDCCLPLDFVQQKGTTLEQFTCLAACNNLDLNVIRMTDDETIESFRKTVKEICSGDGSRILVCTYSRKYLKQTGDGHFSPIGAYHPEKDMILIMDVARFKYPPHWVTIQQMWEAMHYADTTTGKKRGYILMKKTEEYPLILFRLSTTFRVTIATHNLLESNMAKFLTSWTKFLEDSKECQKEHCLHVDDLLTVIFNALNESLASLLESESIFTTQFDTCCFEALPIEHIDSVRKLIKAIEDTNVYKVAFSWVKDFKNNNGQYEKVGGTCENHKHCMLDRIGKPIVGEIKNTDKEDSRNGTVDVEDVQYLKRCPNKNCLRKETSKCTSAIESTTVTGSSKKKLDGDLIRDSHYLTMLILSWPYNLRREAPYQICLSNFVNESLESCDEILLNEAHQLRQQISSLQTMIKKQAKDDR